MQLWLRKSYESVRTGHDDPTWDDAMLPNWFTRAVNASRSADADSIPTRADLNAHCLGSAQG